MEFKSELDKYLYKKRLTVRDFMQQTGLGRSAIYKFINNGTGNRASAFLIEKITNGEVSAESILGMKTKKKRAKKDGI